MILQLMVKLVAVFCLMHSSCGGSYLEDQKREMQIMKDLLKPEKYDKDIRPPSPDNGSSPVTVELNLYVRNIDKVDEVNMEFTLQLTFRQKWVDPRLRYSDPAGQMNYIHIRDPSQVWKPDVFFPNKIEGKLHSILEPSQMMRLSPDGTILFSSRLTLRSSCPMDLQRFPHDRQECLLRMTSYGYTTEDVMFVWKESDPVLIAKTEAFNLPTFTLERFTTDVCTSTTNSGTYSCVVMGLFFKREFSSYLREFYIPSTMLVLLAYLSFWLHPTALASRTVLVTGVMLAMVLSCLEFRRSTVQTSYNKPIDTWSGICMTFVFSAIVELVWVSRLLRQEQQQKIRSLQPDDESSKELLEATVGGDVEATGNFSMQPLGEPGDGRRSTSALHPHSGQMPFWKRWLTILSTTYPPSERIDVLHRIGYPIILGIFQICYWATYLP